MNEFALEHFVSHTLAYKEFKELKKMLENYQITINKEFHLVGNETNLREVTTLVFYNYTNVIFHCTVKKF